MRVTMIGGLVLIGCVACTERTPASSSPSAGEAARAEDEATDREGGGAPDPAPARDRRSWGSAEATERLEGEGMECVEGQGCTRRLPDGTVELIDF